MPRAKQFNDIETLGKATELFWKKGYKNTSIDELVHYTGVSRYGLYGSFGGKKQLFIKALEYYHHHIGHQLFESLELPNASLPAIQQLFHMLEKHASSSKAKMGCFICNSNVEVAPHDKEIANKLASFTKRLNEGFQHALLNAKHNQEINPGINIRKHADFLCSITNGIMVISKTPTPRKTIEHTIEVTLRTLA